MVNPFFCNVFRKDAACFRKIGQDSIFSFLCRKTHCSGVGPSCPFAPERHAWMYAAAGAILALLLLAALAAVYVSRHRRRLTAPTDTWPTAHPQKDPDAEQQQDDAADLKAQLAEFADIVREGGGTLMVVNGIPYCYGYTEPQSPPPAPSCFSSCGQRLRSALRCCKPGSNGSGPCSVLFSFSSLKLLLRTPTVSAALQGVKWAWFVVSLFMSLLTLVTLAKQTQQNKYRVRGAWLLYWAMVQGWLAWLAAFLLTTLFTLLKLLGKFQLPGGILMTVYFAASTMYAFGMLSVITTSCNAPRALAKAIDLVALLQTLLLPAVFLSSRVKLVFAGFAAVDILEVAKPYDITQFADEDELLRKGYCRVSADLRLPSTQQFEAQRVCCGCFNSFTSGPGGLHSTNYNCCCCVATTRCYGDPDHSVMEVRQYRIRWLWYLEQILLLPLRIYFNAMFVLCVGVGVWVTGLSVWYSLVTLAPALLSALLLFV